MTKEIAGVSDVKPFKRFYDPNMIKVVILDEEKRAPGADVVQQVQKHIDAECPIRADVTVVAATEVPINIIAQLVLEYGTDLLTVTDMATNLIVEYLKSIAFKDSFCRYSRIANAILDAQGVIDYTNLTVNAGSANITINDGDVAVLGTVTFT